jgi:hypothetical protein
MLEPSIPPRTAIEGEPPSTFPGPDPSKVEDVVHALDDFIEAVALDGADAPPQVAAFERANLLEEALAALGDDERWADGPRESTASGQVHYYLGRVVEDIASIMGRAGAGRAGYSWIPCREEDEPRSAYAFPSDIRAMEDAARGLAEAMVAMNERGPRASLNPMDRLGPVPQPNVIHLQSLCMAAEHWLEVSQLRNGDNPLRSRRPLVINACNLLCVFREKLGFDARWYNTPGYALLAEALGVIGRRLHEVMKRGHLKWQDGKIGFRPPPFEERPDGSLVSRSYPLYLGPKGTDAVERACKDLRVVLRRLQGNSGGSDPHAARISFDDAKKIVIFDGESLPIAHYPSYSCLKLLFERHPGEMPTSELQSMIGVKGKVRRALDHHLGLTLSGLIVARKGHYSFRLPPSVPGCP